MALRVAFFGTPSFAVPTLERLVSSRHAVVGVITQPDKPRGRGQRVTEGPVKALAVAHRLPVLQPERLARDHFETAFAALGADIGVVAAYGKILPDWLLAAPRLGLVNVHASLLPKYRGASPVHRAVMNGDATTGVTIMRVVKELDAGPMLARVEIPIGADDTTTVVESMLAMRGAEALMQTLDALEAGTAIEEPQDSARATYAPKLAKSEGAIDWSWPAARIHNAIRGLWPWPHAFTFLAGTRYIVHRSRLSGAPHQGAAPGTIVRASAGDGLHIACGEATAIELVDIQVEGKRVVSARDAMASASLAAGARFTTS